MKKMEEYKGEQLVECAKDLIADLDWLIHVYEGKDYRMHWGYDMADAVAEVKTSQHEFNKQLREYLKFASYVIPK